jgi:hypothetical protein
VLPLALWFVVSLAVALYVARRRRSTRDLVSALSLGIMASLVINDSVMYVLTGGVATLAAVARFIPSPAEPVSAVARESCAAAPRPARSESE